MAATSSKMIPLGTKAPEFDLFETQSGKNMSLLELASDIATVVMFICNHCPFVKHIQAKLVETANFYQAKGIRFIAISSNDVLNYPQDGPAQMRTEAMQHHYSFPYLFDDTQKIAKAYNATCTPDFFVFDGQMKCVYRGRFDESTPGNKIPVTGADLRAALDCILTGKPVSEDQKASIGCGIKWRNN